MLQITNDEVIDNFRIINIDFDFFVKAFNESYMGVSTYGKMPEFLEMYKDMLYVAALFELLEKRYTWEREGVMLPSNIEERLIYAEPSAVDQVLDLMHPRTLHEFGQDLFEYIQLSTLTCAERVEADKSPFEVYKVLTKPFEGVW